MLIECIRLMCSLNVLGEVIERIVYTERNIRFVTDIHIGNHIIVMHF